MERKLPSNLYDDIYDLFDDIFLAWLMCERNDIDTAKHKEQREFYSKKADKILERLKEYTNET